MRRRMMMQTMESGAMYPLANGRHEFSDGSSQSTPKDGFNLTQERRKNSMLRAELGRSIGFAPCQATEVILCHF